MSANTALMKMEIGRFQLKTSAKTTEYKFDAFKMQVM